MKHYSNVYLHHSINIYSSSILVVLSLNGKSFFFHTVLRNCLFLNDYLFSHCRNVFFLLHTFFPCQILASKFPFYEVCQERLN